MSFDKIFKEYYEKILNFCYAKIGNRQLAEDCTQEVFLALSKKMHVLRLDTNVSAWLYGAARNEIKRCQRKNRRNNVSVEDLDEIPQQTTENSGTLEELLTAEEYRILEAYYLNGEDIAKLADDKNISVSAMYQRIYRIKQKVIKNSDKLHNLLKK